ncbi:MAG: hypothetical protein JSV16_08590 [Candidatus Hydrogenedentota bacterium]|nr:MAG: hypothetical protein JSV16_08590 [Candidatus Hydrogenedentota bacterium]
MRKTFVLLFSVALLLVPMRSAVSHELKPEEAGHPLRVAAYILHPIGYVLYHGIVKPAHWFISLPGTREVFGHKEDPFQERLWESRAARSPGISGTELEVQPETGVDRGMEPDFGEPGASVEPGQPEMKEQDLPQESPNQVEQPGQHSSATRYNFQPHRKHTDD